ncbi:MAG: N-acetylmuramoyl-L-alanine amidase [Alphaproteobacteria bacterium]|nr:N-acetylmuramoyl-L-alanine amidase [Alphaproteobacteria bacterium]
MKAFALALIAVVVMTMLRPAAAAEPPSAMALRIGQHGLETRFVLDISTSVEFDIFRLSSPYRVVIDLTEVDWHLAAQPAPARSLIAGVKFGQLRRGTSRIILDLNGPYRIKDSFLLPPLSGFPHRLVVDLAPLDATKFAEPNLANPAATKPNPQQRASATSIPVPKIKPRRFVPKVIVIDAGHGGADPGTIGKSGAREKEIVLATARQIGKRLKATGRYRVVMTRNSDIYLKLRDRVAVARKSGADLFISVHADSHPRRNTRGVSVYTLSETASDAEAAALAEKENKSDIIAGFDLSSENHEVTNILIELAQRETMNRSAVFANLLIGELGRRVALLRRTHRFAGFAVLKAPDIPSVLVELGYLSNRGDEKLLRTESHRDKIAEAIVAAVEGYFAEKLRLARS